MNDKQEMFVHTIIPSTAEMNIRWALGIQDSGNFEDDVCTAFDEIEGMRNEERDRYKKELERLTIEIILSYMKQLQKN
jgi:hypothetical protein